jgi:hypothetical protein
VLSDQAAEVSTHGAIETAADIVDEGKPLPGLARRGTADAPTGGQDISGYPAVTRSTISVEGGVLAPSTARSHGPGATRAGTEWLPLG